MIKKYGFQRVTHFCTAALAAAGETYWKYTLDIDDLGHDLHKKVTTNSPQSCKAMSLIHT